MGRLRWQSGPTASSVEVRCRMLGIGGVFEPRQTPFVRLGNKRWINCWSRGEFRSWPYTGNRGGGAECRAGPLARAIAVATAGRVRSWCRTLSSWPAGPARTGLDCALPSGEKKQQQRTTTHTHPSLRAHTTAIPSCAAHLLPPRASPPPTHAALTRVSPVQPAAPHLLLRDRLCAVFPFRLRMNAGKRIGPIKTPPRARVRPV